MYPNRIEVNYPNLRFFGLCGCGSWASDAIVSHPFDRGAFGFRPVRWGIRSLLCATWPVYGGVVARQRCQCNIHCGRGCLIVEDGGAMNGKLLWTIPSFIIQCGVSS